MTIDDTDSRILDILLRDARTSAAGVAEEIGLSRPAVAERIRKLEAAGVVRGYTAVVEPGARGGGVTAFISARSLRHLGEQEQQSLHELSGRAEVEELHNVAGDDCYLIKVRTPDIAGLNQIVRWLNGPPLGFTTKTTIVLGTYFEKVGGVVVRPEDSDDKA